MKRKGERGIEEKEKRAEGLEREKGECIGESEVRRGEGGEERKGGGVAID
jgi:hypothetical protein